MKTILVPIDFSDGVPEVIVVATSFARALGARVVLLHVAPPEPEFVGYDPGPQSVRDNLACQHAAAHQRLHDLESSFKKIGVEITALTIQGYAVEKILEQAAKQSADLLVMGSHGHGALYSLLVGSVTEGVMRRCSCPVVVVPCRVRDP